MQENQRTSHFCSLVLSERKRHGITAEDLAGKAKIDRTYISKIENKNHLPSYPVAKKIADILGPERLMTAYMMEKYPKAAHYFMKLADDITTCQTILQSLERGFKESDILDTYLNYDKLPSMGRARYSEILSKIIKNLETARKYCKEVDAGMRLAKQDRKL